MIVNVIGLNETENPMVRILRWPDEFVEQTPMVTFGPQFIGFLQEMIKSGAVVHAEEHWSSFAIHRGDRIVDYVRRGRLGYGRSECWEVRLGSNGHGILLGTAFGIRDYACVVTAGLDSIRAVTEMWLDGCDVESLIRSVDFWDKMNTVEMLRPPTQADAR